MHWDCAETVEPTALGKILKPMPTVALICLLSRQKRSLEIICQLTDSTCEKLMAACPSSNLLSMWETSTRNHPREQSDEMGCMNTLDDMEKIWHLLILRNSSRLCQSFCSENVNGGIDLWFQACWVVRNPLLNGHWGGMGNIEKLNLT